MSDDKKYPTPEDVKAYDERIANHPITKVSDYVTRYKADPTDQTIGSIMSDICMEIPVMQKKRGNDKTVFFGILNELNDKWRAFVRYSDNDQISKHAFEQVIRQQMPGAYIEWKRYRKLTTRRK